MGARQCWATQTPAHDRDNYLSRCHGLGRGIVIQRKKSIATFEIEDIAYREAVGAIELSASRRMVVVRVYFVLVVLVTCSGNKV